jgi:surface carbohydrate biosynthesis protein
MRMRGASRSNLTRMRAFLLIRRNLLYIGGAFPAVPVWSLMNARGDALRSFRSDSNETFRAKMNRVQREENPAKPSTYEPVVLLVDNKIRDLNGAALIAHHLERMNVPCHLEPLEAFRAVVGAYRPGMIVFNHLNASHLASWSRRLAKLGVLVGVLPNEGFVYDDVSRPFMSGRFHNPHVDHFFCWNGQHRDALLAEGTEKTRNVHVVGVPRFDFYFEPWLRMLAPAPPKTQGRPRVLVCTNFVLASFKEEKDANRDMAYGDVSERATNLRDYGGTIEAHQRGRVRLLDHLNALADDGGFEILLRPHPNEEHSFYQNWLDRLCPERRTRVLYDPSGSITSLILSSDLEISCESCTTAVESWIARKPTIALLFDKHPMLYRKRFAPLNFSCEDPRELPGMVARHLAASDQEEKRELRERHLEAWCATPDGKASLRIASIIADAVKTKRPVDWSALTINDYRRAAKLRVLKALGLPYNYNPLLPIRGLVPSERHAKRTAVYRKTIKPRDVARALDRLRALS